MAVRDNLKTVAIGCAFLGLITWNAVLQTRYESKFREQDENLRSHYNSLKEHEKTMKFIDEATSTRIKRSLSGQPQPTGGATYIRWGRTVCPSGAELVYKGFAGGEMYTNEGGASEYICLSNQPVYASFTSESDSTSWISGVEFELPGKTSTIFGTSNAQPNALQDSDVQCSVCRSVSKTSMIMVPGTTNCPQGWNKEYWGYLMTAHHTHKAKHNYACVDNSPEAGSDGGAVNEGGALMYHVQGWCGSLPCKPYVKGYELTCVVCTK